MIEGIALDQPMRESTTPLLAARNLAVERGGTKVLRAISFALPRGRILGLIGESGAGKSMLGRVIANQLPPGFAATSGSLSFDGTDLLSLPAAARRGLLGDRIAFIPQEPMRALNPSRTIGSHFAEHLKRLGVPKSERRSVTLAALADMRLPEPAIVFNKYAFQLSGGMCQRILIALAFISKPALVIADEPTASLDVTTQVHIIGLLRRLQAKHDTGVLFITHQLGLAAHVCDDVAVLYAGDIVEYGTATAVLRRPQHPYTRMLEAANPRLSGSWQPLLSPPGLMPGLSEFRNLTGCRFAPRCASTTAACLAEQPALRILKEETAIRCTRDDAVPAVAERPPIAAPLEQPRHALAVTPVLQVENLAKTFRNGGIFFGGSESRAVDDISFAVAPGEFVGIVGETGSGKSTLGRMIMGLEKPTAGQIRLDGAAIGHRESDWQRRIGSIQLVFQDPRSALNPRRTVRRLVTQPIQAKPYRRRDLEAAAGLLLQDTGLSPDVALRLPSQLSGGQCQRVNIARGLCATPRILIADEIASGLDVSVQAQILNLLRRLQQEYHIALLMISHDLAVIRYLCDRVLVMCRGKIVESGPTAEVFAAPQHAYTRELVAASPPEDPHQPWTALLAAMQSQASAEAAAG
jgi:peptide/nickel transport system ATP-binding protein